MLKRLLQDRERRKLILFERLIKQQAELNLEAERKRKAKEEEDRAQRETEDLKTREEFYTAKRDVDEEEEEEESLSASSLSGSSWSSVDTEITRICSQQGTHLDLLLDDDGRFVRKKGWVSRNCDIEQLGLSSTSDDSSIDHIRCIMIRV